MMDLRYIDKKKYLLENFSKMGLTKDQLIIILLCINESNIFKLDYDVIKNSLGLDVEAVMQELSSLYKQNLLLPILRKEEDELVEMIDCKNLFEMEVELAKDNVFSELEVIYGKSFSNSEVARISKWISVNNYSLVDIKDAFNKASLNGVKSIAYIEKILESNGSSEVIEPLDFDFNCFE